MDLEFSFGQWIQKRRRALGLSRAALSKRVGYSVAMMRKIEEDERRPSREAAAALAKALEIPQDQQETFLEVARRRRTVDRLGDAREEEPFPWRPPALHKTNLPVPASLFVGREAELARLDALLQEPACRLVTLVGLAGVGKTRLALQLAHRQLERFPHGVFFVPLASLESPEMIVGDIAHRIGFQFYGSAEPQEQLLRYLQAKRMLLVLDNFEHLLGGTSLLSAILQAALEVRLLVTSRERLGLLSEWVFEVEGLPYPFRVDERNVEQLEAYEAVQLFSQGARRVDPGFHLNQENREWVLRICQMMEGLPLGIELAAAWVRVLSCQEIAREIENNLDFLKASAQDIPERHRSLRAALDHSWKLLSKREKEIFPRLSVFRGGFRREAAQVVAGAGLEVVASLLDKSLLKRVGEDRYDLHELIRQYGAAILASSQQEYAGTRDRHSSYYAALLKHWREQYRSPTQREILAQMDIEIENVRLAWSWMAAHGTITDIQKSLGSLWQFYAIRGLLREGAALFAEAVGALEKVAEAQADRSAGRQAVLGHLLAHQGYFTAHLDQYEAADGLLQKSVALLRPTQDRATLAEALAYSANLKYRKGEFMQARQLAQESLELNQALGEQIGIFYCLNTLSDIHLAQGDYQQAYELSSKSLAICRDLLGDPHGTTECLIALSAAARNLGQYARAKRWARESLQISKTLNDRWGLAQILRQLGLIYLELGETCRAETLIRESLTRSREIGDRTLVAKALIGLGAVTAASGALPEAKLYFLEALQTAMETQAVVIVLHAFVEIAMIETKAGAAEKALELVIFSLQHPAIHPQARARAEQLRTELAIQLTPQQIEASLECTQDKTLQDLVQEVLAAA